MIIEYRASAVAGVMGLVCLGACLPPGRNDEGTDVVSSATFSGTINGEVFEGSSSTEFNTVSGGEATCTFTSLPTGFTPATLSPHA